jgi:transposase
MASEIKIDIQDIDHLGIIAGIVDEIGIVEIIDNELGVHAQEKVSAGQVVKAMILNCMGFLSAPLYLFSQFFEGKATEHLIGEGVTAQHLNDSRLGRVLDQLYEYGVTLLFVKIASAVVKRFSISVKSGHLDGTSMSVHGKYLKSIVTETGDTASEDGAEDQAEEDPEPVPIRITQGYSRDHRPDLKQFTLCLLTSEDAGIPLFMKTGDGNELDQRAFPKVIREFQAQWQGEQPEVYVMDAAFYSEANLSDCSVSLNWISRVPASLKAAQELMQSLLPEQFSESDNHKSYRLCSVCSGYAGIKQRWVVVESEPRREADLKSLSKRIDLACQDKLKALKRLGDKAFACEADALTAAKEFDKTLNYHSLSQLQVVRKPHYQPPGRPRPGDESTSYNYHIQATLIENEAVITHYRNQAGRFILATNLLDEQRWPANLILQEYKAQQSTERGFRFLKDPLFFASRVLLKSTQRIMALAMIMTLALMVYSLGQRQLRQALDLASATVPNQKGKPTARPTLRWILQCFQSVHLVSLDGVKSLIKLTQRQRLILQFLGAASHKYYFLC